MRQTVKEFSFKNIIYGCLLLAVIFYTLGSSIIPVITAIILSYLLHPVVDYLVRKTPFGTYSISFLLSVLVLIIFILIPLFMVPALINQSKLILQSVPVILHFINKNILHIFNIKYHLHMILKYSLIKKSLFAHLQYINNKFGFLSPLAHNGIIAIKFVLYVLLVPFIMFYILRDFIKFKAFFLQFIPVRFHIIVRNLLQDLDKLLFAYLSGQIIVMIIMICYYVLSLSIIGLHSSFIVGFLTGFFVFIPYIGILTGFIFGVLIAITQLKFSVLVGVCVSFVLGHFLEGVFITPHFVGVKLGISPVIIILSLIVFAHLFGIIGILLALPLTTITIVLLRYLKNYYINTDYYNQ